jgi:hypothetical protein
MTLNLSDHSMLETESGRLGGWIPALTGMEFGYIYFINDTRLFGTLSGLSASAGIRGG